MMARFHVTLILLFFLFALAAEALRIYNHIDYGMRISALEQRLDAMPTFTPLATENAWQISLPGDKK